MYANHSQCETSFAHYNRNELVLMYKTYFSRKKFFVLFLKRLLLPFVVFLKTLSVTVHYESSIWLGSIPPVIGQKGYSLLQS